MDASDWIAVYAAIVATVVAAFHIYAWKRSRHPNVEVNLGSNFLDFGEGKEIWGAIQIINRSDFPVRVEGVELRIQTMPVGVELDGSPCATLFGELQARDSKSMFVSSDCIEVASAYFAFGTDDPVIATVSISTGEKFVSRPVVFNDQQRER